MRIVPIKHNHSVCVLAYHFVTVTKRRKHELTDAVTIDLFRKAVEKYPLEIHVGEIMPDHVHLMIQAPVTFSPAHIAQLIKGCSSRIIKQVLSEFSGWSTGYYISTTGGSAIDVVENYIRTQKG